MKGEPLFQPGDKGLPGVPGEEYPVGVQVETPAAGKAPAEQIDEFGTVQATEQEQAVYEQFVVKAQEFITENAPSLIQQLNNDQRPVYQNVGDLGLQIVDMVKGLADSAGETVDEDTMLGAGEEVVEMLMDLGNAASIWPFGQDSEKYDEAMAMALSHGAEMAARRIIEQGDPDVKASHEDRLALQIAHEVKQGRGPSDEFFDNLQHNQAEMPRRAMHGVK